MSPSVSGLHPRLAELLRSSGEAFRLFNGYRISWPGWSPLNPPLTELLAKQLGVAPGILVGRMQKSGLLPWTHLNHLKVKLEFPDHD